MTVNISKRLLGIACIFAAVLLPIILGMLTLLPPGFDPPETARFIQFTTPLLLMVMTITVLVNVRESSEARGLGGTSLEPTPPKRRHPADRRCGNAAPLHLPGQGHQLRQPDFTHRCVLRLRPVQHRSADGGRMTDNARKVAGDLAMMDAINTGEDVKPVAVQEGAGPWSSAAVSCRRRPGGR